MSETPMRYGDVLAVLAHVHGVQASNWTRFDARLKNFLRIGWPGSVDKRQGVPTMFAADAFLDMAFVVELTAMGYQPTQCIEMASQCAADFRRAALAGGGVLVPFPAVLDLTPSGCLYIDAGKYHALIAKAAGQ